MAPPVEVRWQLKERIHQDTPDDVWLADVGSRNWIVLTQDRKFHICATEAFAIKQHNLRCFYLPCASEPRWQSLCRFVRGHVRMIEICQRVPAPFIFEMKKNGRIEQVGLP